MSIDMTLSKWAIFIMVVYGENLCFLLSPKNLWQTYNKWTVLTCWYPYLSNFTTVIFTHESKCKTRSYTPRCTACLETEKKSNLRTTKEQPAIDSRYASICIENTFFVWDWHTVYRNLMGNWWKMILWFMWTRSMHFYELWLFLRHKM